MIDFEFACSGLDLQLTQVDIPKPFSQNLFVQEIYLLIRDGRDGLVLVIHGL